MKSFQLVYSIGLTFTSFGVSPLSISHPLALVLANPPRLSCSPLLTSPLLTLAPRYCIKAKSRPAASDNIDMTDFYDDDYDIDDEYDDEDEEENEDGEDSEDSGTGKA